MIFVIRDKVKPYVRMTQRSKWVDPEALEYLVSKASIGQQLRRQMGLSGWEMLPDQTPLGARITFGMPGRLHCQDLDNQVKAVLDAAQGVVFKNDCWVDWVEAQRHKTDDGFYTDLELFVLSSQPARRDDPGGNRFFNESVEQVTQ